MRKGAFWIVMAIVASVVAFGSVGCSDKKATPIDSTATTTDSGVVVADTMEAIISETPMPKTADELFDDFFFNFAANRKLQFQRIKFPLPVESYGKMSTVSKSQWRMDHFFMHQDYYTLIFDNMRQMALVKDTTVSHVVVEKIFLSRNRVKQYKFDREGGKWMLTSINSRAIAANNNSSFLKFYREFATDSAFQVKSINDPLKFTGPDPDDEFSTMSGFLAPEQWLSFAPELPADVIYNILYGQKYAESKRKIFVMRGISNGMETELTFERHGHRWLLMALSM
ncbi:MAG: DUF4348 domain-containing protein [Prevotellaceae bacterium]|nr:DUF4348 domain-containing protein [Prevotella sp.]MDD7421529.1 DUF4348 domain-containing protein [Prevotellaceae bacterium]